MNMKYKKTKAETVNTSDNMTPPSGMPDFTNSSVIKDTRQNHTLCIYL